MRLVIAAALLSPAFSPAADVKPRPAPQLPQKFEWFNTPRSRPLRIEDLRGKVLLVNFWTFG